MSQLLGFAYFIGPPGATPPALDDPTRTRYFEAANPNETQQQAETRAKAAGSNLVSYAPNEVTAVGLQVEQPGNRIVSVPPLDWNLLYMSYNTNGHDGNAFWKADVALTWQLSVAERALTNAAWSSPTGYNAEDRSFVPDPEATARGRFFFTDSTGGITINTPFTLRVQEAGVVNGPIFERHYTPTSQVPTQYNVLYTPTITGGGGGGQPGDLLWNSEALQNFLGNEVVYGTTATKIYQPEAMMDLTVVPGPDNTFTLQENATPNVYTNFKYVYRCDGFFDAAHEQSIAGLQFERGKKLVVYRYQVANTESPVLYAENCTFNDVQAIHFPTT